MRNDDSVIQESIHSDKHNSSVDHEIRYDETLTEINYMHEPTFSTSKRTKETLNSKKSGIS